MNMLGSIAFLLSLYSGIALCAQVPFQLQSQPKYSSGSVIDSELSGFVENLLEAWNVKGVSLAVVRPDGQVELGAWGHRSEDGQKMTADTLFNIASCSKAFLSASVGILIDDYASGRNSTPLPDPVRLGWDTKLIDVLTDDWKLEDKWANEKANIQDILSHVSGLPSHDASYSPADTIKDIVKRLRHLRPVYELREMFSYTNLMYIAGAHIIDTYESSYVKFVKKRIFDVLGMSDSTFSFLRAEETGRLTQSWTLKGRRIPTTAPDKVAELDAGNGGVITTVVDLAKWLKMLLNSGLHPDTSEVVLPRSAFDAITTGHSILSGRGHTPEMSLQAYGMGWGRYSYHGHEFLTHSGTRLGFSSQVTFLPNDSLGVAILVNAFNQADLTKALTLKITERVLGLPKLTLAPIPPQVTPPRRSRNSTTPVPLSAYAGTYSNVGYGSFTLCEPSASSPHCQSVLANFRAAGLVSERVPELFAAWERAYGTHLRLTHVEGHVFRYSVTKLYPEGFGADRTPFSVDDFDAFLGTFDFVVEEGRVVGMGLMDVRAAVHTAGGTRERADAWFDKV